VEFPDPFDHFLALVLVVAFPLRAKFVGYGRLLHTPPADQPGIRRWLYAQAMALQWGLALVRLASWAYGHKHHRPWGMLGLTLKPTPELLLVLGIAMTAAAVLFWQARRIARSEPALERVRTKLGAMRLILPHTHDERRRFLWLSLTAGVCEELLYRGFLMAYFGHWLGPLPSLLISAAVFGLGHLYQGPRGVLLTGLVGGFLGALYLLCGSIVPSMLLHAAGDMYSGWIAHAALSRDPAASAPLTEPAAVPPPTP
jgi:membrane protease YdiL (CAAX protease family)